MNAKYYQKDQKNKSVGIVRVAAVVLILLSAGLLYQMYVETHFQIYDSALRFHVRAASDAPEDQRRKLLVRDAVLWEIRPEADQAESAGELVEEDRRDASGNRGCGGRRIARSRSKEQPDS